MGFIRTWRWKSGLSSLNSALDHSVLQLRNGIGLNTNAGIHCQMQLLRKAYPFLIQFHYLGRHTLTGIPGAVSGLSQAEELERESLQSRGIFQQIWKKIVISWSDCWFWKSINKDCVKYPSDLLQQHIEMDSSSFRYMAQRSQLMIHANSLLIKWESFLSSSSMC